MTDVKDASQEAQVAEGATSLGSPAEGQVEASINWAAEPAALYSDFAVVGNRELGDFSILFCCISQQPVERGPDGKYVARARPVASIKMNPKVFFAFLQAVTTNWNKWARGVDPSNPVFELKIAEPKPPEERNASSE